MFVIRSSCNEWHGGKQVITQSLMFFGITTQIAKFMGPAWGPPGSCRPQMGPMLAPWTLLSGRPQNLHHMLCNWVHNDLICVYLYHVYDASELCVIFWHQESAQSKHLQRLSYAPQCMHNESWRCKYWKGNLDIKTRIVFVVIDEFVWYTHKSWHAYRTKLYNNLSVSEHCFYQDIIS